MPDVSITPSTMSIDAQSLDTLATSLDNIASTLRSSLSGTEGMAGDDETGRAFAHGTDEFTGYDTAGTNTLNAVYTAAGFLRSFEALVSNTGRAYDNATFAATDAGGESSIAAITAPASATSSSVPSAEGAGSDEWLRNLGWIGEGIEMVLDKLREWGITFPLVDKDEVEHAKAAWLAAQQSLSSKANTLSSDLSQVLAMEFPQSGDVDTARTKLVALIDAIAQGAGDMADFCQSMIDAFWDTVQTLIEFLVQLVAEILIEIGLSVALGSVTFGLGAAVGVAKIAATIGRWAITIADKCGDLARVVRGLGARLVNNQIRIQRLAQAVIKDGAIAGVAGGVTNAGFQIYEHQAKGESFDFVELLASAGGSAVGGGVGTVVGSGLSQIGRRGLPDGTSTAGINSSRLGRTGVGALSGGFDGFVSTLVEGAMGQDINMEAGVGLGMLFGGGFGAASGTPTTHTPGAGGTSASLPNASSIPATVGGASSTNVGGSGSNGVGVGDGNIPTPGSAGGSATSPSGGPSIDVGGDAPTPGGGGDVPTPAGGGEAPTPGSAEAPVAPSAEAPAAPSAEAPATPSAEAPAAPSAEAPAAPSAEAPAAPSAEAPTAPSAEAPAAPTAEAPAAPSAEAPAAPSAEAPAAPASEAPAAPSAEAPAAPATEAPASEPSAPADAAPAAPATVDPSAIPAVEVPTANDGQAPVVSAPASAAQPAGGPAATVDIDAIDVAGIDVDGTHVQAQVEAEAAATAEQDAPATDVDPAAVDPAPVAAGETPVAETPAGETTAPEAEEGASPLDEISPEHAAVGAAAAAGLAAVAPTLTPSRLTPSAGGNGGQTPAADGTTTDPGRSDDPTLNRDAEGDGWRREQDLEPVDPEYGTPQSDSGALDPDARYASNTPAPDVADVNPAMRDLLDGYPEAPYGRDEHGTPLTKEQFEARYVDADGNLRYPRNAGAVPGSIVTFESVDAFRAVYGDVRLDRIGNERGRYFSIEGTPFRERALPPGTLRDTYATMDLTSLPPNARIEVSRIAPAFGQPGGGLQIRILDMDSPDGNGWYNAYNQAGLAAPEVGALQNVESHVPQTDAAPAAADAKPANPPRFTPGEASASAPSGVAGGAPDSHPPAPRFGDANDAPVAEGSDGTATSTEGEVTAAEEGVSSTEASDESQPGGAESASPTVPETRFDPMLDAHLPRLTEAESLAERVTLNHAGYTADPARYGFNCHYVVQTFELRSRGYDVIAAPTVKSAMFDSDGVRHDIGEGRFTFYIESDWVRPDGQVPRFTPLRDHGSDALSAIEALTRSWEVGARGVIQGQWTGGGGGHVFNVVRTTEGIQLVDAQNGKLDASGYVTDMEFDSMSILRTDDLEPTPALLDAVRPNTPEAIAEIEKWRKVTDGEGRIADPHRVPRERIEHEYRENARWQALNDGAIARLEQTLADPRITHTQARYVRAWIEALHTQNANLTMGLERFRFELEHRSGIPWLHASAPTEALEDERLKER